MLGRSMAVPRDSRKWCSRASTSQPSGRKAKRSSSGCRTSASESPARKITWPDTQYSTAPAVVKKELQEAGYRLVEEQDLERQTLLVFEVGAP